MAMAHSTPLATREARILGTVAHAGGVFGVVPSLAMYVVLRDHDERTAEQSRLALNWQLTLGVLLVAVVICDFVLSSIAFSAGAFGLVSLLAWILLVPWALGAAVAAWAGIRFWRSGSWSYPWSIPFVGTDAARKRRELLDVIGPDEDGGPTPLATLALWFGVLGGVLGIVFGHVARARIRRTGEDGWGTATAGLVIGYAEVAVGVIIVTGILLSLGSMRPFAS